MSKSVIHNVQRFIWNLDFYWLFLRIAKSAHAPAWGLSVWSRQPLIHSLKPFDLLQIAACIIYIELPTYFGKLDWFSPVSCIPARCFKIQNFNCFHDYWLLLQFSEMSVSAWNSWGSVETSFWRTGKKSYSLLNWTTIKTCSGCCYASLFCNFPSFELEYKVSIPVWLPLRQGKASSCKILQINLVLHLTVAHVLFFWLLVTFHKLFHVTM